MKIVIIDTSTEKSVVCIAQDLNPVFIEFLPEGFRSSSHVFPAIESGLQEFAIQISDLAAIAVTVGPGLFTGLRVGAAIAKGMAFPHQLPLIGLSSLEGFVAPEDCVFASVIDARIGGAYVLMQERSGEEIRVLDTPRLVSKEELPKIVGDRLAVGPSFERLSLKKTLECAPDPAHLARLAAQKFTTDQTASELDLVYMRETV